MYRYPKLTRAVIERRYKRFLADVILESGEKVTAHCPNTGSMRSCWYPGASVLLSHSNNPKRNLAWTLECVDTGAGWVGVNTTRVNHIIATGIENQAIAALAGYQTLKKEPRIEITGFPASRFDLLLQHSRRAACYVEIKNTTLLVGDTVMFPDAVSVRARKHLLLLAECRQQGFRSVILFAINRPEGRFFSPARDIDPAYARTLESVHAKGVEIILVRLAHDESAVKITGSVQITAK